MADQGYIFLVFWVFLLPRNTGIPDIEEWIPLGRRLDLALTSRMYKVIQVVTPYNTSLLTVSVNPNCEMTGLVIIGNVWGGSAHQRWYIHFSRGEYHVRTTMVSGFKLGIKTMLSASELHSVYTCNAQKTYHNNVHVDVHLERTINNTTTKLYNELK